MYVVFKAYVVVLVGIATSLCVKWQLKVGPKGSQGVRLVPGEKYEPIQSQDPKMTPTAAPIITLFTEDLFEKIARRKIAVIGLPTAYTTVAAI